MMFDKNMCETNLYCVRESLSSNADADADTNTDVDGEISKWSCLVSLVTLSQKIHYSLTL